MRNQDSAIQFNMAMQIPENRDQTWKFIKSHWDQVQTEFTPELGEYFVAGTGNFCSAEARDDVKNFFATHPVPATDAALKHAIEHIDGCIELRRLQEPNLKTWLAAQRAVGETARYSRSADRRTSIVQIRKRSYSLRRRAQASSSSASCLAKQKRSRFSPRPGRKNADPATAATPVARSRWRAFSAAVLPGRRSALAMM